MSEQTERRVLSWLPLLLAFALAMIAWGDMRRDVLAQGIEVKEATAVNIDQGIDIATLKSMAANQEVTNTEAIRRLDTLIAILNAARKQAANTNSHETQYASEGNSATQ